jgi:hypothetical protein
METAGGLLKILGAFAKNAAKNAPITFRRVCRPARIIPVTTPELTDGFSSKSDTEKV